VRSFARGLRFEVAEKVERAVFTARVKPVRRAGKKAEDVGFVIAVQVDNEVKLLLADLRYELRDAPNRDQCRTITQRDTIDFKDLVGITAEIQQFLAGFADGDRDLSVRKLLAYRPQRRQTHHDVSELAKINDEYVARIEHIFKPRIYAE